MAGKPKQKQKILFLLRILYEKTDEQNGLTLTELLAELEKADVKCERKSLYRDLDALSEAGFTVGVHRSKETRYYWANRSVSPGDVAFLVHLLQSAPMISRKRKQEWKKKLNGLIPTAYQKKNPINALTVLPDYSVSERVNSMAEVLFDAIQRRNKVRFSYRDSVASHRRPRSRQCTVSPYRLVWKDGYYLVAADEDRVLTFYRVDRMENLSLTPQTAVDIYEVGGDLDFDLNQYILGYFASLDDPIHTIFRVSPSFLSTAERFFPTDATVEPAVDGSFLLTCEIAADETLFGWLLLHSEEIRLLYPESLVTQIRAFSQSSFRTYGGSEDPKAE